MSVAAFCRAGRGVCQVPRLNTSYSRLSITSMGCRSSIKHSMMVNFHPFTTHAGVVTTGLAGGFKAQAVLYFTHLGNSDTWHQQSLTFITWAARHLRCSFLWLVHATFSSGATSAHHQRALLSRASFLVSSAHLHLSTFSFIFRISPSFGYGSGLRCTFHSNQHLIFITL